jgi:hypothetical protein
MTKIKNFRIHLRAREIGRLLKAQSKLQLTPELEASIEHAITHWKRILQPAAVYTTLTRGTAEKATALPLADPAVAVSTIAATIGPALDQEIQAATDRQDTLQAALLSALRDEALQQAVQFIGRLIDDQAKDEECDLSEMRVVEDGVLAASLGSLLGAQRIGIPVNPDTSKLPPHSRLVWTVWTAKVRVKAAARSGARPEKAAV